MTTVPDGVYTALITPCPDDGSVDTDAIGTLIDCQTGTGIWEYEQNVLDSLGVQRTDLEGHHH